MSGNILPFPKPAKPVQSAAAAPAHEAAVEACAWAVRAKPDGMVMMRSADLRIVIDRLALFEGGFLPPPGAA